MSAYPTQIDNSDTLGVGADRIGSFTLETTLTAACLSGDTTIAVADAIAPGFAAAAMHLRIGDEIVKYTGRSATSFTGLSRGLGGTAATAHAAGTPVRAIFTWLQMLALQQAITAIETALGVTGAFNFADIAHSHAASAITFAPTGAVAATTVQAAIAEVDAEKAALSHVHSGSDVTSGTVAAARLPVMGAASAGAAGTAGVVGAPAAGDQAKFWRGDATWQTISAGSTTAALVSVAAAGSMPSGNAQQILETCYNDRVPTSRQVNAGAGLTGGGDLSADLTLNADVRQVFGRTGNVAAAAGDYNATQVDISASGMPGWMSSPSTVKQAIDALISKIGALESGLSIYLTTSTAASTYLTIATHLAHSHNATINADGGHDHSGTVTAEADHTHSGYTSTPI